MREPVCAASLLGCIREAGHSERPSEEYCLIHVEAGLCRRPRSIHEGSSARREVHNNAPHRRESRCMPEVFLSVSGKPDEAQGPVEATNRNAWKPVYARGHTVVMWEPWQAGVPGDTATRRYLHVSTQVTATREICVHHSARHLHCPSETQTHDTHCSHHPKAQLQRQSRDRFPRLCLQHMENFN